MGLFTRFEDRYSDKIQTAVQQMRETRKPAADNGFDYDVVFDPDNKVHTRLENHIIPARFRETAVVVLLDVSDMIGMEKEGKKLKPHEKLATHILRRLEGIEDAETRMATVANEKEGFVGNFVKALEAKRRELGLAGKTEKVLELPAIGGYGGSIPEKLPPYNEAAAKKLIRHEFRGKITVAFHLANPYPTETNSKSDIMAEVGKQLEGVKEFCAAIEGLTVEQVIAGPGASALSSPGTPTSGSHALETRPDGPRKAAPKLPPGVRRSAPQ